MRSGAIAPQHRAKQETQAGPYALTYDDAGNMTRKLGGTVDLTLEWSADNKLTRTLTGAVDIRYSYSASNARIMKRDVQALSGAADSRPR